MPVTTAPRPAIRFRPAPALDPPYDDEAEAPTWAGPGEQLALDLTARPRRAAVPAPRHRPAERAMERAVAGASAESMSAVGRFVRLCLEIFNGYRPTGHVRPMASPAQAAGIVEQVGLARERVVALSRPPAARVARSARPAGARVALRRLRVCEPCGGVAEAAVVLAAGGRCLAMAVRLERHHGRWLCTAARAV